MATAKQIAWRRKFAARYGGKKRKAKARKAKRSPKRYAYRTKGGKRRYITEAGMVKSMARRRSPVRRRVSRAYGRFRRNRTNVVPLVDVLHGLYTVDGATAGAASKAANETLGVMSGRVTDVMTPVRTLETGANVALKDPKTAIIGAGKNFALVWLVRRGLGLLGLPKSVKIFGKTRIQTR